MLFMVRMPRKDDVLLTINNTGDEGCVDIMLQDDCLAQELTYRVEIEDLKLAIRKLSAK